MFALPVERDDMFSLWTLYSSNTPDCLSRVILRPYELVASSLPAASD